MTTLGCGEIGEFAWEGMGGVGRTILFVCAVDKKKLARVEKEFDIII